MFSLCVCVCLFVPTFPIYKDTTYNALRLILMTLSELDLSYLNYLTYLNLANYIGNDSTSK